MGYRVEETIEADSKSSAADLLATRVNGESIEVLSAEAIPIGEWAAFELRLTTSEVFLEGMGRCEACASSGNGHRVRLGTLQFDVMNEVMYERVHLAAESLMTGERTGEVNIAALEAIRKAELSPSATPSPSSSATPSATPSPPPPPPPVRSGGPPKPPASLSPPSWRPPPPLRSRTTSSPPPAKAPSLRPPPIATPAQVPTLQTASAGASSSEQPGADPPPLPRPPPAPVESAEAPKEVSTVSGFPAPPPEAPAPKATRVSAFASRPPRSSSLPPKKSEGVGTPRERLEPLLLAMRRGGAARHLEDAEELAMELGLQTLERIFGN